MHLRWDPSMGSAMRGAMVLVIAVLVAELLHAILYSLLRRMRREKGTTPDVLVAHTKNSTRAIFILVALTIALIKIRPTAWGEEAVQRSLEVGYIAAFTWLTVSFVGIGQALVLRRLPSDEDNIRARQVKTRVSLLRQTLIWLIVFVGFAAILMTFPAIRDLGTGLFASAGVAGLVLGMAARPTLGNFIAGIQIAISQPLRIGDTVVVEGQSGRVLEINTTYVVIRAWDLRHIIVPISHFIEKSFENWTRYNSELVGAVLLQMDYSVPVQQVRQYYLSELAGSPLWDGKRAALQVTDSTATTIELRFLMSAPSPALLFDLRCTMREKMLEYLQKEHPSSLPRTRTEVNLTNPGGSPPDAQL